MRGFRGFVYVGVGRVLECVFWGGACSGVCVMSGEVTSRVVAVSCRVLYRVCDVLC